MYVAVVARSVRHYWTPTLSDSHLIGRQNVDHAHDKYRDYSLNLASQLSFVHFSSAYSCPVGYGRKEKHRRRW